MEKIIELGNHPIKKRKDMAKHRAPNCPLINYELDMQDCRKTNPNCKYCEVTTHYEEARKSLTRLSLTGRL